MAEEIHAGYGDRTPLEVPAEWAHDEGITIAGPCCACRQERTLRNIVCMAFQGPLNAHGKGWGCVVCGLPTDGAIAVVCDDCRESAAPILDVCSGYAADPGRAEAASLRDKPWAHRRERHGDEDGV